MYDLSKKSFIRSRDVIFDETKFHNFTRKQSINQKSNFEYLVNESVELPYVVLNNNENDDHAVQNEIPEPVRENRKQTVGGTYEDNFTHEVNNLNPRRERRSPVRYDKEVYAADDLTADVNEPRNISEAWPCEYSEQWKDATNSEYSSLIENGT